MHAKPVLEIDALGWSRLQANQPRHRLFFELFQNAKDEPQTTQIRIDLTPVPGVPLVDFVVTDDGLGFADLRHAYTLFAPSAKMSDPRQSGFMNMGEKACIVGCTTLTIATTSGTVEFDMGELTRREYPRRRSTRGTVVSGRMRMTRAEYDDTLAALRTLLVPERISLVVGGEPVLRREPLCSFSACLPTRLLEDGELVTRSRAARVDLYLPGEGESPTLYEMGIPVVGHDIEYHVDVQQKVILNKDRDNVTPSYLQTLRVLSLEHAAAFLTAVDASEGWVRAAAGDERASRDTVERVLDLRFGEKRVVASVSDPEANCRAVAEGYTLIHSRTLAAGERDNARRYDLLPVSHSLFPTPKPYSAGGLPVEVMDESDYTPGIARVVAYAHFLARGLLGRDVTVRVVTPPFGTCPFSACYGKSSGLDFNYTRLGKKWFERITAATDALLIHEFGHHFESNHLSEAYYDALCDLGARLKALALRDPASFAPYLD